MCRFDLTDNWHIRYEELEVGPNMAADVLNKEEGWLKVDLPCDIHIPLIENGIIKEPVEADNCLSCEWTEDKSWWFKKEFHVEEELLKGDVLELTIESLDSEADIFLNSVHLGHHRSAFYPFKKDVKSFVLKGENVLLVRVTSGLEHYCESDVAAFKRYSFLVGTYNRGDARRLMVRKPQYVYGWDWGPRVATCGIMGGVYLESFTRLTLSWVQIYTKTASVDAKLGFALEVENLHPFSTFDGTVKLEIFLEDQKIACFKQEELFRSGLNFIEGEIEIENAKLWWPNGMGQQPLYTIKASVESETAIHEYKPFKIGVKTIRLNQEKIADGRKFAFEINGVEIFCKGGNWIPADSIYTRVTEEKYNTLIREAKGANFNMLRIWGGGIYEPELFYEKCDENGILVWHDFMFSCGLYPDNLEWFKKEVEHEMDYQTKRLRNHVSIALWCGNNENHWASFDEIDGREKPSYPGGAVCYNTLAPHIVHQNCPHIPYWNSSPYGGEHSNSYEYGDAHIWRDHMMNHDMEKRVTLEEYDKVSSKFVSEYGYIGPCCKSSIIKYHAGNSLDIKGRIWDIHNNTFEEDTVPAGIAKHYTDPGKLDMDSYLFYAGLCQGIIYGYSLESIRFKEHCGGSLFWMYNDTWGEIGWTIIDYYLKRKPSYYFVKRAFTLVKLIIREQDGIIKVLGVNETENRIELDAEFGYTSLSGDVRDSKQTVLKLEPYSRSIVLEYEKGNHDFSNGLCFVKPIKEINDVMPAVLRPGNFKDLNIPVATLVVSNIVINKGTVKFTVTSDCYAHAVHFNLGDDIHLSDEYFDLLPGESREVEAYFVPQGFSVENIKSEYVK